ncbi:MAG: SatD family protein, partial [Halanaerobium sp.]
SIKNIEYPDTLIHPFKIAKGDEMQAIFNSDLNIPVFLRSLRNNILPLKIRIGIGVGNLDNEKEIVSWESSGKAFCYSEEALEKIDRDRKFKTMFKSGSKIDELINTIFLLLDTIEFNWSEAEWNAVNNDEFSQSAHLEEIKYAEKQLNLLIKNNL